MTMRGTVRMSNPSMAVLAVMCLATGCTVGPNFVRPVPQVPAHWSPTAASTGVLPPSSAPRHGTVTEDSEQRNWWAQFNDPMLDSLIARALEANLDLRAAVLRIEEARAQRDLAAAGSWPSAAVDGSYSRQRFSETTPTGSLLNSVGGLPIRSGISVPNPYSQYELSADASWEIDLFGRIRRSVEAAKASVQVSVEDQHAARLALLADVAQNYLNLRGAQSRLQVAHENLKTLDELLELTRERLAAGLTTQIDVNNAKAQQSATEAEFPVLELQITQDIHQMSLLLAKEPEALRSELTAAAPVPSVPYEIPVGLPAEMARQRPDIRQAEANLHAATAQIGVAVADLFPRLTLSGSGGYQSDSAGRLVEWASRFGSFGPTLSLPVFDRGKWKTIRLQNLRAQDAALSYRRTVLNALHEVENALAAYAADQRRRDWLTTTVAQNSEALELSRQRYENGVSNFTDVLNVERMLQQNQALLIDGVTAESTDLVRLDRALGGGWQTKKALKP